jgi:hypothetical protein
MSMPRRTKRIWLAENPGPAAETECIPGDNSETRKAPSDKVMTALAARVSSLTTNTLCT